MNEATWGQKIVLVIIGIVVVIVLMFNILKTIRCSPDEKVKEVALPLATVIIKYIEKNGVPENLKDIDKLPYQLVKCKKSIDTRFFALAEKEECTFLNKDKIYYLVIVNIHEKKYNNINIHIRQDKTTCKYLLLQNTKNKKWRYIHYPKHRTSYDWDSWVCNPKLFRITD